MKTIILLVLVAGAFAQVTVEQQLLLQKQQPLGLQTNPLSLQLQQLLLQQQLQGFGGLGLANQFYNPFLLNPFLLQNPVNPLLPISGLPAVDVVKEIDILTPTGITGSVDLEPLDAVIMDNKNKGVGHHEIYTWGRSALPKAGRSSIGRTAQQTRVVPNRWSHNINRRFPSPPFTVDNPTHFEINQYA